MTDSNRERIYWYVVVWQECDKCEKEPNDGKPVRIDDRFFTGSGKYIQMRCQYCGKVCEFKRSFWYTLDDLDDELEVDGSMIKVKDLPDWQPYLPNAWHH